MIINILTNLFNGILLIGCLLRAIIKLYPVFALWIGLVLAAAAGLFLFRKQVFHFFKSALFHYNKMNAAAAKRLCTFIFGYHPSLLVFFLSLFIIIALLIKNSNLICRILLAPVFMRFFFTLCSEIIVRAGITSKLPGKPAWVFASSLLVKIENTVGTYNFLVAQGIIIGAWGLHTGLVIAEVSVAYMDSYSLFGLTTMGSIWFFIWREVFVTFYYVLGGVPTDMFGPLTLWGRVGSYDESGHRIVRTKEALDKAEDQASDNRLLFHLGVLIGFIIVAVNMIVK